MEQLEDEIKLKTGGIRASTHVTTNHSNLEITEEGLVFSGYCLDKNVPNMLELLRTILLETNFYAVSKLRTLIQGIASGFVNSLAEGGHNYARTFAAAHLTPAAVRPEYNLCANLADTILESHRSVGRHDSSEVD